MPTEFKVPDATCGHCKSNIEAAVSQVSGVRNADFDLELKRLTVDHEIDIAKDALAAAIVAAGYSPEVVT